MDQVVSLSKSKFTRKSFFIIIPVLLVLAVILVLLLKSYARQKFEKVGHVDIPTKRITTVSLKLIDGEKLIYRGLNDAESFLQNIPLLNNLIIFIDENKINVYDKKTKTLKNLSVPEEIRMKTENNSNIYISAYDLNDRTIYKY